METTKTVLQTIKRLSDVKGLIDGMPSPGVVNCHNLDSEIYNLVDRGIDLSWAEAVDDLEDVCRQELEESGWESGDSSEYDNAFQELLEQKTEELSCFWEGGSCILVGDWKQGEDGKYAIDHDGSEGWAGTYSNENGSILTVEWSKWVAQCNQTSPCYIRVDTGGRCGDLDTPGDMYAYCVPADLF